MDDKEKKLKDLLKAIKLDVKDIAVFEKDIDSILSMFDQLNTIEVERESAELVKKRIKLNELRDDEPKDWNFRPELRGKYFEVPSVSKKK